MRQVLVISTGLAPQVVTEMLWWFVASPVGPGIAPDEIHVATTRMGAEAAEAAFLGSASKLQELCLEFGLPDLRTRLRLHWATADGLGPGDDTRNLETSIGYANMVTHLLQDLTADPGARVHACLAGGRKTMSFYLGYAMSLIGRDCDELSHILVSPPAFESCPDFWWIPKEPRRIRVGLRSEAVWRSTDEAVIEVVPIPFVRLRHFMGRDLLDDRNVNFSRFVIDAKAAVNRQRLVLDDKNLVASIGDQAVRLPPKK